MWYLQGVLYCLARFLIEFFREGPMPVWGLTGAQWACLAGLAFFGVRLLRLLRPAPTQTGAKAVPAR